MTALALCILFIWGNSLQTGEVSGDMSGTVMEWIKRILGPESPITEYAIRKAAHFSEYALEGVCVVLVFLAFGAFHRRNAGNGLLIGAFTALIDELIQAGVAGRTSAVTDVWIDIFGFGCGALVTVGIVLLARRKSVKIGI